MTTEYERGVRDGALTVLWLLSLAAVMEEDHTDEWADFYR